MQFPFANTRPSRTDAADQAATQAANAASVEARHPADGPQVLSAQELRLVSGGDGDANSLPVTKW